MDGLFAITADGGPRPAARSTEGRAPAAMFVSGFTIIRNAIKYSFPVRESILSLLPLCDEFIVFVGDSEDGTRDLVGSIGDPRLRIFDSRWRDGLTGGRVLAEQTSLALAKCRGEWAVYIQADEVIHEDDREAIRRSMEDNLARLEVQGLLFDYVHFYGSYGIQAVGRRWYRREVRIVRNGVGIEPYKDAQGFRLHGRRIAARPSGGRIFHYGWVRRPDIMGKKNRDFARLWGEERSSEFSFEGMYGLRPFLGTHPGVMKNLIERQDWEFHPCRDGRFHLRNARYVLSDLIEKYTGRRLWEFRNYTLIK